MLRKQITKCERGASLQDTNICEATHVAEGDTYRRRARKHGGALRRYNCGAESFWQPLVEGNQDVGCCAAMSSRTARHPAATVGQARAAPKWQFKHREAHLAAGAHFFPNFFISSANQASAKTLAFASPPEALKVMPLHLPPTPCSLIGAIECPDARPTPGCPDAELHPRAHARAPAARAPARTLAQMPTRPPARAFGEAPTRSPACRPGAHQQCLSS